MAMLRNMVTDFLRLGRIRTTDSKAKELRSFAERLITNAKAGTLHARRRAAMVLRDKEVVRKLFAEIAPHFKDRPGGYTRITKLGYRVGDNAPISLIELVEEDYKPKSQKKKRTKKAKVKSTDAEAAAKGERGEVEAKSPKKEAAKDLGLMNAEEGVTPEATQGEGVVVEYEASAKAPNEPAPPAAAEDDATTKDIEPAKADKSEAKAPKSAEPEAAAEAQKADSEAGGEHEPGADAPPSEDESNKSE